MTGGVLIGEMTVQGRPQFAALLRHTARTLTADHPAADVIELLTSELVGNALLHSTSGAPGGMVTMSVRSAGSAITVDVTDQGGGATIPTVADEDPFAEYGRGLQLLRMLAKEWGVEIDDDTGGVTVCFTIDADQPSAGWACNT